MFTYLHFWAQPAAGGWGRCKDTMEVESALLGRALGRAWVVVEGVWSGSWGLQKLGEGEEVVVEGQVGCPAGLGTWKAQG